MASEFYYCLTDRRVESGDDVCRAIDRLGPYPTRADAQAALETVKARNEAWENDPRFNNAAEDDEDCRDENDYEGWGPFKH